MSKKVLKNVEKGDIREFAYFIRENEKIFCRKKDYAILGKIK
nr:hypothetical protein [Clostridium sp. 12(A)]